MRTRVLPLLVILVLVGCGAPDAALRPGAKPSGRILFVENGDLALWDGSHVQRVTQVGDAASPSFAPDGQRFVVVRRDNGWSDLLVGQLGSDQEQQLTHDKPAGQVGTEDFVNNASWALDPDWARNGDTIAYASDLGTQQIGLWLIQGLGNPPKAVPAAAKNQQPIESPRLSPDATQVVYTQRVEPDTSLDRTTELWVIGLATSKLTPLVQGTGGSYDPTWSPDGRWIAFVQRTDKSNDLWIVPATGGQATKLTEGVQVAAPVWSPDGANLAFLTVDGPGFMTDWVSVSVDASGAPHASSPQTLFKADGIDAPSGLSWAR